MNRNDPKKRKKNKVSNKFIRKFKTRGHKIKRNVLDPIMSSHKSRPIDKNDGIKAYQHDLEEKIQIERRRSSLVNEIDIYNKINNEGALLAMSTGGGVVQAEGDFQRLRSKEDLIGPDSSSMQSVYGLYRRRYYKPKLSGLSGNAKYSVLDQINSAKKETMRDVGMPNVDGYIWDNFKYGKELKSTSGQAEALKKQKDEEGLGQFFNFYGHEETSNLRHDGGGEVIPKSFTPSTKISSDIYSMSILENDNYRNKLNKLNEEYMQDILDQMIYQRENQLTKLREASARRMSNAKEPSSGEKKTKRSRKAKSTARKLSVGSVDEELYLSSDRLKSMVFASLSVKELQKGGIIPGGDPASLRKLRNQRINSSKRFRHKNLEAPKNSPSRFLTKMRSQGAPEFTSSKISASHVKRRGKGRLDIRKLLQIEEQKPRLYLFK